MPPVDVAGRPIAPDLGSQSFSSSAPCADLEGNAPWPEIGEAQWRSLKRSIVDAGMAGAISPETAHRMINRFSLREV